MQVSKQFENSEVLEDSAINFKQSRLMAAKTGKEKVKMPPEYIEWLIRRLIGAKEPFTNEQSRIDTYEIPTQTSNGSEAPHLVPLPYLECIYLQEVYGGGFLVNRTIKITREHWNGIMNGKCKEKAMSYCALCKCEFYGYAGHLRTPEHESLLRDCQVLREYGYALIRKVGSEENHCAICNTVFTEADAANHLTSETHNSLFREATEQVSQLLKKWGKLRKLHKFNVTESDKIKFYKAEARQDVSASTLTQAMSETSVANSKTNSGSGDTEIKKSKKANEPDREKSKFLTMKTVREIIGKGFIVNNEVLISMQSWNTYMNLDENIFCQVCQVKMEEFNESCHTNGMSHRENLRKYDFLKDYRLDLIRRLPSNKFHCGLCAEVVLIAATHVATPLHLKNYLTSLEEAKKLSETSKKVGGSC